MNPIHAEDSAAIMDPIGLHARPAVKLTQLAKKFSARIEIRPENSDKWVNAKSISILMPIESAPWRETLFASEWRRRGCCS